MDTLFSEALAAIQVGRRDAARKMLVEVVRANPRHEQAWLALASVVDDRDKAADCLKRVLALNPKNATALQWLATETQDKAPAGAVAETAGEAAAPDEILVREPGDETRPVPRLGQYLLDYKFVTVEQLKAALLAQRKAAEAGQARRLGDIVVEQGAVTDERLNFAVRQQQRSLDSLAYD